jgi:hypothetical protein
MEPEEYWNDWFSKKIIPKSGRSYFTNGITRKKLPKITEGFENREFINESYISLNHNPSNIDVCDAIDKYADSNYIYKLNDSGTDFKTFRENFSDHLIEKLKNVNEKIQEYQSFEDEFLKKYDLVSKTDNIKITELLFFKTLNDILIDMLQWIPS